MPSLPTLPRKTWQHHATSVLALVVLALGVGYFLNLLDSLDLAFNGSGAGPWQTVFASGCCLVAMSVLFVVNGTPPFAWAGLIAALLGTIALLPSGSTSWLTVSVPPPGTLAGAMPPIAALVLLAAGGILPWLAFPGTQSRRAPWIALVGSLLAAIGTATLAGHSLDLPVASTWGSSVSLPPSSALLILTLGATLLMLAAREHARGAGGIPPWLPLPVVIGSAMLTIIISAGLRERELYYLGSSAQINISNLASAIKFELQQDTATLERLSQRWGTEGVPDIPVRESDAFTLVSGIRGEQPVANSPEQPVVQSLDWIPYPDKKTDWFYPRAANDGLIGFIQSSVPERSNAMTVAAGSSKSPAISLTVLLGTARRPGFVIYSPVYHDGNLVGLLGLEMTYSGFFANLDQRLHTSDHHLCKIYVGSDPDPVYTSVNAEGVVNDSASSESSFKIANRPVRIVLTPTQDYLQRNRGFLPDFALAAGLGITLLLGLSIHLARAALAGLLAAGDSNRRLLAENDERRRIEAMLKVSDERLNLALDSTAIGIFEWNTVTGEVLGNTGLWTILGLAPESALSLPALWEPLVHPDDLAVFCSSRDAQLAGTEGFIDPEYRVRSLQGGWRWIYVRSKTVASAPDGTPTRIVGTLQDVTARKEAETALGESQTAARKLSLVASKTDNLVIIAKPDGTIEWVNSSFERLMEYSLAEVVGRNPARFMVGRETSPHTVRRIRLALARGEGFSTEIVNYAKSGRKFYLHLEIQPVRNGQGVLENFIAIQTDITARVETENALRRAKTEADAASRSKSEFLASLSHEIRTPMNGVIGMTSLLLDTTLNPDQRDCVNTIRTSGEALLTIINDILDFSKIESGKLEVDHHPFELAYCIEETLDLFNAQAASRQVELAFVIAPDVPALVLGDANRVRQVLGNLVNNAIKFTPAGRVSVEARLLPPTRTTPPGRCSIEVAVRDTGIGIPADRIDRLFKPFSQVDSSTTRKYGGTGLGLAICHRLCLLMNGAIRVESVSGQGSAFIFSFMVERVAPDRLPALPVLPASLPAGSRVLCADDNPVRLRRLQIFFTQVGLSATTVTTTAAAVQALRAPAAPQLVLVDLFLPAAGEPDWPGAFATTSVPVIGLLPAGQTVAPPWDTAPNFAPLPVPVRTLALLRALQTLFPGDASQAAAPQAEQKLLAQEIPLNVLLVEDNAVNQKVALRFLERLGYQAQVAYNGREALEAIAKQDFNFILMDLQMPEMDGFETTREIRRRLPVARQPHIVALTANALQADRDQSMAIGMDDFITKPFKLQDLVNLIRRVSKLPPRSAPKP